MSAWDGCTHEVIFCGKMLPGLSEVTVRKQLMETMLLDPTLVASLAFNGTSQVIFRCPSMQIAKNAASIFWKAGISCEIRAINRRDESLGGIFRRRLFGILPCSFKKSRTS